MTIIDPPVNAFSPPEAIAAWLATLQAMPESPERDAAISEAKEWSNAD